MTDLSDRIDDARRRALSLLEQLTLHEKLRLVHGGGRPSRAEPDGTAGTILGVPRLGIPDLVMADGPNGVGNGSTGVTSFPASVACAATWDPELSRRLGAAMGREHRVKGHGVALTPTVNILRVPHWGRSFETMGEDPHLAGVLAAAQIEGLHSAGVLATVKHLAVNNQESSRWSVDAVVGERALREIYLPAFEACVDAGVLVVMAAYNRVNGRFAAENAHLLRDILKDEWGFRGFTVSDWAATHSAVGSAVGGLDVEMPHGPAPAYPVHYGDELEAAVIAGEVPLPVLDDMVVRVLTAMAAGGLLDPTPAGESGQATTREHRALARRAVAQSTVLLRNEDGVLPLAPDVRRIAVIGTAAHEQAMNTGGGSAKVVSGTFSTPLDGIRDRAGERIRVTYSPGTGGTDMLPDFSVGTLASPAGTAGWLAEYFETGDQTGTATTVHEPVLDRSLAAGAGRTTVWSARWRAAFTPEATGRHRVSLDASGYATFRIGSVELANDGRDLSAVTHATVDLIAGNPVEVEVHYRAELLEKRTPRVGVGILPPDPELLAEAVASARAADVAVVVVNDLRTEGGDVPTLALPGDQDELIAAIAAVNTRTVVVVHSAGAVLMPWLEDVAGVLAAWYPGQESGAGLADVLFGDAEPSGRLPLTFPSADDDFAAGGDPSLYPGVDDVVRYDEGILVGYRWWQATARTPLFPFGFGLGYTEFEYSDLRIDRTDDGLAVTWRLANVGSRAGRDVPQIYLTHPVAADEPPRQLQGFRSVAVDAGAAIDVTVELRSRTLRRWDSEGSRWSIADGAYTVEVGASSADIRLRGMFEHRSG